MTSAIIVAAGRSQRMGFDKLAADLAGRPVLVHSLRAFQACEAIGEIVLVTAPERFAWAREWAEREGLGKLARIVAGGEQRHDSVWRGLEAADPRAEWIAVHDGARPLVTPAAIGRALAAAREHGAAALAHRVTDTVKRADAAGFVAAAVPRDDLWAMETPQIFAADLLRRAYRAILDRGEIVTDEVSALCSLGEPVRLVENPEPNPKITFPGDLALAAALLAGANS